MTLTAEIKAQANALGFDLARMTPVRPAPDAPALAAWLAAGMHGEMAYMAQRTGVRSDPAELAPGAASMIMLAANYNPGPPPPGWSDPARGRIARYAWSHDYHEIIKARLFALDAFIRGQTGRQALGKACVDTAPFLERDFAFQAGLGFIGKNTVLITPGLGSWTFLAALLIPEELDFDAVPESEEPGGRDESVKDNLHADTPELAPRRHVSSPIRWQLKGPDDAPHLGTCGTCTRCLGACPTRAFVGPYILDARRCISYLTIELRGPIPRELRPLMGNWVFGCDICQEVCPYNREAAPARWPSLTPDRDRAAPLLLQLLALDDNEFRERFRGTAVLRTKRRGMVRNACVAVGNWGDPAAVPMLSALLADAEPLLRGHAAWALGRIGDPAREEALESAHLRGTDAYVREELTLALTENNL